MEPPGLVPAPARLACSLLPALDQPTTRSLANWTPVHDRLLPIGLTGLRGQSYRKTREEPGVVALLGVALFSCGGVSIASCGSAADPVAAPGRGSGRTPGPSHPASIDRGGHYGFVTAVARA